jgi:hypothetical protein
VDFAGDEATELMPWDAALAIVRALIQASGEASAAAGVTRDHYIRTMFETLEGTGRGPAA